MKINTMIVLKGLFFGLAKIYCYYLVVNTLFQWDSIALYKKVLGLFLFAVMLFYEVVLVAENSKKK
jgi:hypothetical protein